MSASPIPCMNRMVKQLPEQVRDEDPKTRRSIEFWSKLKSTPLPDTMGGAT